MANILESSRVIEYRIAKEFNAKDGHHTAAEFGGAATVGAEESLTGNTQIFVNPNASSIAEDRMSSILGRGKSSDGKALEFSDDIVDSHEFGHGYANIIDNVSVNSNTSNQRARDFENFIRARRGLPNRRIRE